MRRATIPALVIVVGILLLADLLVVNDSLGELAGIAIDAVILVAAGAALAAAASLGLRRATDLWQRRGDPVGAALVLIGLLGVLLAGLRPGSTGATDPAVQWILVALVVPIGATLFALLFVTTLAAAIRSVRLGGRQALVLVVAALAVIVLLLPVGGSIGDSMAGLAGWVLDVPIGAVFRGLLIGITVSGAVLAARTLLGAGAADE